MRYNNLTNDKKSRTATYDIANKSFRVLQSTSLTTSFTMSDRDMLRFLLLPAPARILSPAFARLHWVNNKPHDKIVREHRQA